MQDLFQVSSSSSTSSVSSSLASTSTAINSTTASQSALPNTASTNVSGNFFNFQNQFINQFTNQLDTSFVILALNRFLLGWTIFYSIYFILHFWWKRLDRAGELKNEQSGVAGIFECLYIWLRYLGFLVLMSIFALSQNPVFQLISLPLIILYGIYKIWADISGATKFASSFGWAEEVVKTLQKVFKG